jgi:hypothetical protein
MSSSAVPRGASNPVRVALLAIAAWGLWAPATAHAFCRTTTSKVPADYDPALSGCWTAGLPVYWSNACVSYDIQQSASKQMSYDVAAEAIASAFSTWTGTACSGAGGGSGRVSINVVDLGPVECSLVEYDQTGPNQHVIVFRDTSWPYDDSSNTLALTTVSYDKDTGEIYDVDMEINSADYALSTAATVPPGGYDFESIVTHETGHFLGMAHSQDTLATMYAHYTPGSEAMRELTADDIDGICTIYPPDGMRAVSVDASATGTLPEVTCDPTPRHGFTTQCMSAGSSSSSASPSTSSSCALRRQARDGRDESAGAFALLGAITVGSVLRRRRNGAAHR